MTTTAPEPIQPELALTKPTPRVDVAPLPGGPEVPASDTDADQGNRRRDPAAEAANRRHQLREVETERDTLRSQLAASRREHVEALLHADTDLRGDGAAGGVILHRPADLWEVIGVNVDDLYTGDGTLDRNAVADAIDAGIAGRAYLARASMRGVPDVPPTDPVREALERQRWSPLGHHRTPDTGTTWKGALNSNP
ncbi:hypothetical protein C3B61_06965 [Cryobacterium zongtaii]|uniref:Uncharacterized protein n=1 Tax=Cryobacterium zongtaii TaxID=1259217 RepID=A0A2S3ZJ62_9MICO|nr:hypothetical protein [Cryobacterium zongtaii]POH67629.1 hypothetical protein C3B61_06965 [Cryobacterium zongtaii]